MKSHIINQIVKPILAGMIAFGLPIVLLILLNSIGLLRPVSVVILVVMFFWIVGSIILVLTDLINDLTRDSGGRYNG